MADRAELGLDRADNTGEIRPSPVIRIVCGVVRQIIPAGPAHGAVTHHELHAGAGVGQQGG